MRSNIKFLATLRASFVDTFFAKELKPANSNIITVISNSLSFIVTLKIDGQKENFATKVTK